MIGSRGFPGEDGGAALPDRAGFPLDGLTLDRAAAAPLHRQLYELLRSYILEARLDAGSLLPATTVVHGSARLASGGRVG